MIGLEMQGFEPWTDENIVRTRSAKLYMNRAQIAHKYKYRAQIINITHE